MSVKLPQAVPPLSKWVDIDLGAEQSLQLLLLRPSFAQQAEVLAAQSQVEFLEARIRASVTDWKDVTDDADQPVAFSWPSLQALFATYPQALSRVNLAVVDVWITHPGDLAKNLPTPPVSGGTETTGETAASTVLSASIISSPDAPPLELSSAPSSTP